MRGRISNRTTVEKCMAARVQAEAKYKKTKARFSFTKKVEKEAIRTQENALSWLPQFAAATYPDGTLPRIREFVYICRAAKYLSTEFSQTDVKHWLQKIGYVPDGQGFILKSIRTSGIRKINPSQPKPTVTTRKKRATLAQISFEEHELIFTHDRIANLSLGKKIIKRESSMVQGRAIFGKADEEKVIQTFGGNGVQYHHRYLNHLQPFAITYNNDGIYINHSLI